MQMRENAIESHRLAAAEPSSPAGAPSGRSDASDGRNAEADGVGDGPLRAWPKPGMGNAEPLCCDAPNSTLARAAASLDI